MTPPALTAGFVVACARADIVRAFQQALRLYVGEPLSVELLEGGKGPQVNVVVGELLACYSGGLLIQGPRYRTFINWLDIWTGHARVQDAAGDAIITVIQELCGIRDPGTAAAL
jgi:hypothetical protein